MRQNFIPWGGGGVCVYFLKSVRKARFRNAWVGGGGLGELQIGRNGVMLEGPLIILMPNRPRCCPLHKGRDPIGAHIPLMNWNIFLQFFPILQPALMTLSL